MGQVLHGSATSAIALPWLSSCRMRTIFVSLYIQSSVSKLYIVHLIPSPELIDESGAMKINPMLPSSALVEYGEDHKNRSDQN